MDRSIVLVDAGYLLGAAHTTASGRGLLGTASIRYPELLAGLVAQAEERAGVPPLRVYWYSPWPETHSGADLRTLQQLPNVKVRLGAAQGEINDQAGVSTPLQRDLITLARNHAVSDAILLTADENLTGAIEEAQTYGIRVHLWGVQAANGSHGQSHTMIASADCRIVISAAWVGQHVDVLAADASSSNLPTTPATGAIPPPTASLTGHVDSDGWQHQRLELPESESFAPDRAWTSLDDPPASRRAARDTSTGGFDLASERPATTDHSSLSPYGDSCGSPEMTTGAHEMFPPQTRRAASRSEVRADELGLTGPVPTGLEHSLEYDRLEAYLSDWSSTPTSYSDVNPGALDAFDGTHGFDGPSGYESMPLRSDTIMRLAEITSTAQASVDQHQDSSAYGLSVDEIGYRFGLRWASRTSADQLDALVGRYTPPNLPRKIATELDEYAAHMGIEGPESELIHHALALAFWAALVPAASERF